MGSNTPALVMRFSKIINVNWYFEIKEYN